ncbi:MAG: NAD-dependent epimerase/dehydratase family protein [Myxococcales bacterium]
MAHDTTVLITGICGRLAREVARALHRIRPVVGVDCRPFPDRPKDIEHHEVDLRRKKLKDLFRTSGLGAVVHLGMLHDPGFSKLLEYVAQFRIPKLVVLSSANVYGPHPDNAQFLKEDSPLLGGREISDIRDLIEVDMLTQSFFWKEPHTETVLLRPAHILGRVKNAESNYLRLPTVPTVMGYDPMLQVVDELDVVQAVTRALEPGARGVFNIAGAPAAPLSRLLALLGRKHVAVPHTMARVIVDQLWRFRLTGFAGPELDHLRYVCMVDDRRARLKLKYAPEVSLEATLATLDADRWLPAA